MRKLHALAGVFTEPVWAARWDTGRSQERNL
jgi:hypothetical protein